MKQLTVQDLKQYNLLPRIKAELGRIVPNAQVVVYGSVARGEATEQSDIDLLILLDNKTDGRLRLSDTAPIVNALNQLEFETGVSINPTIKTKSEWTNRPFRTPFYCNVENEGIRL